MQQGRWLQVVGQRPARSLPAGEAPDAVRGPCHLLLECREQQGLGAQERRRRAAGGVVAGESERVQQYQGRKIMIAAVPNLRAAPWALVGGGHRPHQEAEHIRTAELVAMALMPLRRRSFRFGCHGFLFSEILFLFAIQARTRARESQWLDESAAAGSGQKGSSSRGGATGAAEQQACTGCVASVWHVSCSLGATVAKAPFRGAGHARKPQSTRASGSCIVATAGPDLSAKRE